MQDTILEEYQIEMENRIRNLLWTVSGDYTLEMKPNVETFLRSKRWRCMTGSNRGPSRSITTKTSWECIWSKRFSCRDWRRR